MKLVRDQWLEYQQMTAALEGDKASAEALAKKGNLLSGEKALAAVANFRIAERIIVLQSCEMAQRINVSTQLGNAVSPQVLESEISSALLAQKEILAGKPRKIDSYNAPNNVLAGKPRKIDSYNAPNNVLAGKPRKIDSYNALMIGNVISQTAAASNSVKLNRGPKIEP